MALFSTGNWTKKLLTVCVAVLASSAVAQESPPLPVLPDTPEIRVAEYPGCRNDYRRHDDAFERADEVNNCLRTLNTYNDTILAEYRQRMIAHQTEIARIYEEDVRSNFDYPRPVAEEFFAQVTQEHDDSNPDGAHFRTALALETQYLADRTFLQERFCRYAGSCADYVAHSEAAERDEADGAVSEGRRQARRSRGDGEDNCGTARAGGGILGSILGGIVGEATGVGAIGGIIAGGFAGTLVAAIACQLEPAEQAVAAEATDQVTEQEEVGATATWTSPTRADVSGSSTVTALNSQPNGARCMDVTDVVIVEGEETRISKRMCRGPGESRYTLDA